MTPDLAELGTRWDNLAFDLHRSIRYHQRRQVFFDRLDQIGNMLSVILGSTAIYGVLEKDYKALALVASALVTITSATNLVFGSSRRAREHSDFVRQYMGLEKRMLEDPTEALLKELNLARLTIEADEPPALQVLNCICHNETLRAYDYPKELYVKIHWWQRVFAQFIDVRADLIQA